MKVGLWAMIMFMARDQVPDTIHSLFKSLVKVNNAGNSQR